MEQATLSASRPVVGGLNPLGGAIALAALASLWAPPLAMAEGTTATATHAEAKGAMLGLDELIALALANNRQIHMDSTRIGEARALYQIAAAQAYPAFSGQFLFGGPVSEAKTAVRNDPATLTPASLEGDTNFGTLGVTLRFSATGYLPIMTFGKIDAAKDAAQGVIGAAQEKVRITEGEVLVNIHRAFWAYQLTVGFASSLREGEEILTKIIKKVNELLDNDSPQVTENDRLRLTHAQATLRVRLVEADAAQRIAEAALKLLIGRPQTEALLVATADIEELPTPPPPLTLLADALADRRPELKALRHLVDAQDAFLRFRTRQLLPDFFIGGFLETALTTNATDQTNPFISDRFNFFDSGVGLGLRFQLDVFNKLALIEQAEAELNTRLAENDAAREAVELELRKIHTDLSGLYARLEPAEQAFRAARSWLTAAALAYDIGTGSARELIDAFLARAAAEADLRRTQYEIQIGSADLLRAAGTLVEEARQRGGAHAADR